MIIALSKRVIGAAALAALVATAASAATVPDRRVTRAPTTRAATSAPAAPRQELLELYTQLETLQQQLREMRGQLEVQAHEIERLNRRQMESMVDFDRRLRGIEQRTAASDAGAGSAPTAIVTSPVSAAATTRLSTPTLDERKQYDAAFALMKQGLYEQASKGFRAFVASHAKSALADNAQYWVGEVAYVTRDFRGAIEEYGKVLNSYPDSPKVPDALLKMGYAHQELGANDKAREILQGVVTRFPNTTVAKAAEQRLAKLPKAN